MAEVCYIDGNMKHEIIKTLKAFIIAIGILTILAGLVWGAAVHVPKWKAHHQERVAQLQAERQKAEVVRVAQETIRKHKELEAAQAEVERKNAERSALLANAVQMPPNEMQTDTGWKITYRAIVQDITQKGIVILIKANGQTSVMTRRGYQTGPAGSMAGLHPAEYDTVTKNLSLGDVEWADRTVLIRSYPHPESLAIGDIFPQTMCSPTSNTDSVKTFIAL